MTIEIIGMRVDLIRMSNDVIRDEGLQVNWGPDDSSAGQYLYFGFQVYKCASDNVEYEYKYKCTGISEVQV